MPKFVYVVSRRVCKMEAACKQGKGPDEANQRHQPTTLWDRKIMKLEDINLGTGTQLDIHLSQKPNLSKKPKSHCSE